MNIKLSDHFTYKRLLRFVLPSIVMMVFTSIYGVVDGLFISNFAGKTAFAAINLIYPCIQIFGSFGFMFGTGGSALVAKVLGEKQPEKADRYFSMIVITSALVSLVLSVIGIACMAPIARLLGAEEDMIGSCVLYGRITLAFSAAFSLQNAFQSFLITAEKPKLGLAVTVAAGVSNMILDALFVGVFRWGVAGAAVATGLSQCVGGLIPLFYFLRPNSSLLRLTKTRLEFRPILRTCTNGASEMVSNITASVVGMLYNFQLLKYAGADGVAAYGVLMYVNFIFVAIFIGYSIGAAPIVSYHYGAQDHKELQNLLKKSLILMGTLGLVMFLMAEMLAWPLGRLFVGYDQGLLEMTVHGFRICALTFLAAGFNIFSSSFFTALNNGGVSAAISFLRTFVLKFSAVLLLPSLFGLDGIWWSEPAAEICAFFIAAAFLIGLRKRYHYFSGSAPIQD